MNSRIPTLIQLLIASSISAQVWEAQQLGLPDSHRAYFVVAPNTTDAWTYSSEVDSVNATLITENGWELRRTDDQGATWQTVDYPHTTPGWFANISALDANTAWVCYVDYAEGNKLLKTTDGGENWVEQPIGITVWLNIAHFFNDSIGFAMGDPGEDGFEIFTTTNGGDSWEQVDPKTIPANVPNEVGYGSYYEVVGSEIWFETSHNRVYYSPDMGHTWSVFEGPQPQSGYYILMAVDEAGVVYISYVIDDSENNTDPYITLYRSFDNGETWEDITPADNRWTIVDIEPIPGTNVIIGQFTRGFITEIFETRISYDHGASWFTIDNITPVVTFDFVDSEHGYAGGWQPANDLSDSEVYRYIGSPLTGLFDPKPLDACLRIFPNPTSDFIAIQLEAAGHHACMVLINDMEGRLLHKENIAFNDVWQRSVDLREYVPGAYTLTVTTQAGVVAHKFNKQ